ncbi:hypothetical protein GCM10008955_29580 [Deinococcus malanensis]|uniref:Uncharacterized protein n=1 Tax=Deinococcus malanensis TaxID=1706855 RepID=A0ABQ2F2A3_9DEIO|nr:hypothetical protein [Deinococcus malanensis]GGK33617.1 hypothetical protein GCM10008955_29580 [Deinococcus malanensis]
MTAAREVFGYKRLALSERLEPRHGAPVASQAERSIGGFVHGSELSLADASRLTGMPEYLESWTIVPLTRGRLVVAWVESLGLHDLEVSMHWHEIEIMAAELEGIRTVLLA